MSILQNKILRKLSDDDLTVLRAVLEPVELPTKEVLIERHQPIQYIYFPENCVCSVLAKAEDVPPIEVGMIGVEGMTDPLVIGRDHVPLRTVVQVPGRSWRVSGADFSRLIGDLPSLRQAALLFRQSLSIQFAYTALAHGSFTIEERLARWLLMSHDRAQRTEIPYVHEFIAAMLAVRRSGVTAAIHVLEGTGAIRATRGQITIRDRTMLMELAGGCYGEPEAEYERLFA